MKARELLNTVSGRASSFCAWAHSDAPDWYCISRKIQQMHVITLQQQHQENRKKRA